MKNAQHNRQQGFSLIEIMLALTIGLILLMALSSLFITANELSKDRDVLAEVDEKARLVFDYIGNDLSRAGYVDIYDTPKTQFGGTCANHATNKPYINFFNLSDSKVKDVFARSFRGAGASTPEQMTTIGFISCGYMQPVIGCKGNFSKAPSRSEKINSNCSNTGKETEQSIRLAYQVASMGSVGTLENNTSLQKASDLKKAGVVSEDNKRVIDCSGEETTDDDNGFVINEYSLKNGSLQCRGNSGKPATPMVLGVEELSFRYLITPPEKATTPISRSNSGKAVASYNTADKIADNNNTLEWAGVVGVEICIVVAAKTSSNSFAIGLSNTQGDSYRSCKRQSDGTFTNQTKADKRYYRRYIRTFAIPNTIYATKGSA